MKITAVLAGAEAKPLPVRMAMVRGSIAVRTCWHPCCRGRFDCIVDRFELPPAHRLGLPAPHNDNRRAA